MKKLYTNLYESREIEEMYHSDNNIERVRKMSYLERLALSQKGISKTLKMLGCGVTMPVIMLLFISSLCYGKEIGKASYYTYESCVREGTSGVYTASGERYDENGFTCAKWDVPFGTMLRVTNVENGKSVSVRVNDRGPSKRLVKQGRIIDLTKNVFAILTEDHLEKGIIVVEVTRIR